MVRSLPLRKTLAVTLSLLAGCLASTPSASAAAGAGLTGAAHLSYEVLVTDGAPRLGQPPLPDGEAVISSPVSSTLIFGERDAVLVDPPLTVAQTTQVVDLIVRSGKHLKYVYSTHGHGDHWFGTAQVLRRFPDAIAYATPGTIGVMERAASTGRARYEKDFPGQLGATPVLARPVPPQGLELEGNVLQPIEMGHSDTDSTTVLYVPSIGLVVAGDVAYNGIHQYLLEGGNGGLQAWLEAIDKVEALHPSAVVAGHKQRARGDDPACLEDTRRYLQDALRLLSSKPALSPTQFFDQMVTLHPDRINAGPLWYSAVGLLGARHDAVAQPASGSSRPAER